MLFQWHCDGCHCKSAARLVGHPQNVTSCWPSGGDESCAAKTTGSVENLPSSPLTHRALTISSGPYLGPEQTRTSPSGTSTYGSLKHNGQPYTTPLVVLNIPKMLLSGHSQSRLMATLSSNLQILRFFGTQTLSRSEFSAPDRQEPSLMGQDTRHCHGRSCTQMQYAPWHLK